MTEAKTTIIGGEIRRGLVSDEIAGALHQANDRIAAMDTDPIIRLALARVAIRSFAAEIARTFGDHLADLADDFEAMAAQMRDDRMELPREIRSALTETEAAETAGGEETDAEDREPGGTAGRRRQADPEGRDAGGARGFRPRDHGSQRLGKEHAVLRVGGA